MSTLAGTVHDVFISHASEDKRRFVDALDAALRERGVTCWYDSREIQLGDDFRRKMDEGLARARYGVVVLSPNFFKYWPESELSALFNQEATFAQSRILPVRLDLDRATLTLRLPLLAARADISWEQGVDVVADRIRDVLRAGVAPTPAVRSRPYNLPVRRARKLFGREADIERLLTLLVPGRSVRVAASVEGLAGVGKTELAFHLVDKLSETDRFPGGIFWFDAENPNLTPQWGGVIADAVAVGSGSLGERAAAAVRVASSGGPVLVVLDNVGRWTRDSEPRPLPSGSHISLLVTTRYKFLAGSSFDHYTLEALGPEAARSFLTSVADRDLGRVRGTEELLAHLGGHALALELAGVYLREFPTVSPQAYLDDLTAGRHTEDSVTDLVRYERSVRQALDVHQRHLDPIARSALRIAACFAPEDASTTLLAACGAGGEAQQPLRRFHLIAGDGERWRMHRLVRTWALETGTAEEIGSARRSFVQGCVAHAGTIDLAEGFRLYQADGPHLEKAIGEIQSILGSQDERVAELLDRVGTALHSAGDLPRAKELLEQALASDLKNLGAEHPSVAAGRSNLALVLKDLGDLPRAKELLEQALASKLKNLGAEHPSLATDRSNLASVLKDLGDLPRAKELLEQALASDLKNLGAEHPSVATGRSNLAGVLQDLGDLPQAKELLEQALASDLKNLGAGHPSVAAGRSNLALVLKDLGDLPRAKELLEQALASDLKNLGAEHPSVARGRSNLAAVLQGLGDLPQAKELLEQALASELKNLGAEHPSVARDQSNLATVLQDLDDLPQAKELLERALASDLKNLGAQHPSVATHRFNLAEIYVEQHDLAGARVLFAQALAAEERSLGPDHPSTAYTRVSLAKVLAGLGEVESARREAARAVQAVANQPAGLNYRRLVERIATQVLESGRDAPYD